MEAADDEEKVAAKDDQEEAAKADEWDAVKDAEDVQEKNDADVIVPYPRPIISMMSNISSTLLASSSSLNLFIGSLLSERYRD